MTKKRGPDGCCCSILQNVKFQITVFIIGTISGLTAFFAFWLMMEMIYAAVLGGVSAVIAFSLVLEILCQHKTKNGRIMPRTESKVQLVTKFVISIVGLSTGVGFMFYLIAIGIATNARFDSGLYMGAIQAWMTFKWSASWIAHLSHHHRLSEDRIQEEWEEDEEERKPLNESSIV